MRKTRKIRGGQSSVNIIDSAQISVNNIINIFTSLDKTKIYKLSNNVKTKIITLNNTLNRTVSLLRSLGVENTDIVPPYGSLPIIREAISMTPTIENIFISNINSIGYNLNIIIAYLQSISSPPSDNNIPIVSLQMRCIQAYYFILLMFLSEVPAPRPSPRPAPRPAPRPSPISALR